MNEASPETVRFTVPHRRGLRVEIPRTKYEASVATARELLQRRDGYLAPSERTELEGLIARTDILVTTNLERTVQRIIELEEAGIPPLFDRGISGMNSSFPVLDYLIQLPTGRLHKNWIRQHIAGRNRGKQRVRTQIYPSRLRDIQEFRTFAFDEQHLSSEVIREIGARIEQFEFKAQDPAMVLKTDYIALKYLEASLRDVQSPPRQYKTYTPNGSLDFLREAFWHTQYTPEDRLKIAREFKARVDSGEKLFTSDETQRRVKRIMQKIFPEIAGEGYRPERGRMQQRMAKCERDRNYVQMPQAVLADHDLGPRSIEQVKAHIRRKIDELAAKSQLAIFQNIGRDSDGVPGLYQDLAIPPTLLYLHEFRDIVTERRLEVLQGLDDTTFRGYFTLPRVASLGHRRMGDESLIDRQFRSALLERYRGVIAIP